MTSSPPPIPRAGEGASPPPEVSALWIQPPWRETLFRFLMHAVMLVSAAAAMWLLLRATGQVFPLGTLYILIAVFAMVGLLFLTTAIHEGGHFLAARHAGQTVVRAQLGPFEFIAGRSGWRARRRKAAMNVGGYVMACADYSRPWRPQMLWMMSGGIAANLVAALVFAALALSLPGPWSPLAWAIAVQNAGHGLANAFPTRIAMPSDGMQLLAWWRGIAEDHPDLIASRVTSASIAGHTADEVSDADLATLDDGPLPSQVLAQWIRLKAAQMRGEWAASADAGRALEALCGSASPDLTKRLADLRWMARVDAAFSQALADGRPDALRSLEFDEGPHWLCPYRWPRTQALLAAFEGNISLRDALLAESARWAEDSVDGAVGVSEKKLSLVAPIFYKSSQL